MKSNDSSNNRFKKKQKTNECLDNYRSKCLLFSKWRGMVNAKINKAAPYFFFLTGVKDLMSTYDEDLTITFPGKYILLLDLNVYFLKKIKIMFFFFFFFGFLDSELLDSSLGTLEHSLHINFMVEFPWLMAQYAINDINNPSMTILYGVDNDDLRRIPSHLKVTAIKVKSPYPFGHHHT